MNPDVRHSSSVSKKAIDAGKSAYETTDPRTRVLAHVVRGAAPVIRAERDAEIAAMLRAREDVPGKSETYGDLADKFEQWARENP